MSPVSRGRKGKRNKQSTRRSSPPPEVLITPDTCDCPACSGEEFDPQELIDDLTSGAAELVACDDPLEVELAGATLLSIGYSAGEGFDAVLVDGLIPQFEAQATTEAMVMLLAISVVAEGRAAKAASSAADRLAEAGVARPQWATELNQPVTVDECVRLRDPEGTASILSATFHRAGRAHAIMTGVDHLDCGAANEVLLVPEEALPQALELVRTEGRANGLEFINEVLDPAEFRWQVECALDARAVHDGDEWEPDELGGDDDEDGPPYPVLAVLTRARMNALPMSSKPKPPHGNGSDDGAGPAGLQEMAQIVAGGAGRFAARSLDLFGERVVETPLPAKRKKSNPPAPVYQLKVGLRGTKPPIWRRLEVPADISLAELHSVIQIAFDWTDSHLHVFETPYGSFGTADAGLGQRADAPVTLEQVAPGQRSKLCYTYDFGDDWQHDILVEKVLERDDALAYPRCTGGRRAAPPEDCGGVWGYDELVEVLSDPTHPEHDDRLDWLGLTDAAEFDPADFDAAAVTRALSR